MSVDGPRTSVFTFQSAVHSVHVLRSLDEQRQKDVLCDLTVEVECRSFRAHRSVLACCSEYFYTRLQNNTGWNLVINLPDEVTVEGFAPLLQFAYTAKLHFTKDNILEIHRCAELLGFRNLDKACFDFLIPKFSDGSGNTQEAKRKSKNGNKSKAFHEKPSAANEDCNTTIEDDTNTEMDSIPQVPEVGMLPSVVSGTDNVPQVPEVGMLPIVVSGTDNVPHVPEVGMLPCVPAGIDNVPQVPEVGMLPSVPAGIDNVPQVPKVGMLPSVPAGTDSVYQISEIGTVPSFPAGTDSVHQINEVGTVPNMPSGTDIVPQVPEVDTEPIVQSVLKSPEECLAVSSNKDLPVDVPSVSFQTGSGQDRTELCLHNCGPQLPLSSSVPASEVCPFLSVTCTRDDKNVHRSTAGCDGDILEMGEAFQNGLSMDVALDVPGEPSVSKTLNMPNLTEGHFNQPVRVLEPSAECRQLRSLSPTETSEVLDSIASVTNLESINSEAPQTFDTNEQIFPDPAPIDGSTERSTVEREVAEHLAKGFWPDIRSPLADPLESMEQAAVENGADFHWLKHLDLGAAPDDCPFLRDLSSKEGQASGGDNLSKEESRESSLMSPINSGENSECDTEGDCETVGEQVCEVELPFPAEQIPSMSRRAFLQMLKEQRLTPEQLEFVQDVRRRSKNRMAARRCRKKKLDCIYRLEGDIKKLRTQKEKLLQERSQLKQNMDEMRQSVSGLCQIACPEASAQPEQLTILARYLSSDCPTSLPFTPVACPGLAAPDQDDLPDTCLEASVTGQSPNDCPQGNRAGTEPTSTLFQDDAQSDVTETHVP